MKDKMDLLSADKNEIELSKLMVLSQEGDSESYKKLLLRTRDLVRVYIRNSFKRFHKPADDSIEDVLQEVLLAIHQKRETYNPEMFYLPWMYAIARYKIIDFFRRNRVHFNSRVSIDDELEHLESLSGLDNDFVDLEKIMDMLSEKQREILRLVKLEGLTIEETAQKTGYSVSDIKVSVHRSIKTLQQKLKED